jgi:hypothetical protein
MKNLSILGLTFLLACNSATNNHRDESTKTVVDNASTVKDTNNQLTEAEQKEGWQLLFDGSTTKGWHNYGNKPVGAAWKVSDGSLHLDATEKDNWQIKGGGDIVCDSVYGNFHLKLEWKIDTAGNSGIMLFVNEDTIKYKYPWMTGPEMQVLDNALHADSKIPKHRAGDLYDLIACSQETVKPALEWNQVEIKNKDGQLEFYLNGVNVVKTTLWDDAWKKMVAASKFKEWKDFGTYKEGRIALQDHGNHVWYRNIMIKKL